MPGLGAFSQSLGGVDPDLLAFDKGFGRLYISASPPLLIFGLLWMLNDP